MIRPTTGDLPPNSVRLVLDPAANGAIVSLYWRDPEGKVHADPFKKEDAASNKAGKTEHKRTGSQDHPSIRALALGFLVVKLYELIPAELLALQTLTVGKKRGWPLVLTAASSGDSFLRTLANAVDGKNQTTDPNGNLLGKQLRKLPGFAPPQNWNATRGKGEKSSPSIATKQRIPNVGAQVTGRPGFFFRRLGDEADLEDADALLELARSIEETGNWEVQLFHLPVPPPPPPFPPAVKRYLEHVIQQSSILDLTDFGAEAVKGASGRVSLAKVFVDLDTDATVAVERSGGVDGTKGNETRKLTAVEAILKNRRLALLGMPGGGKSTLLRYLSLQRASVGLPGAAPGLEKLSGWPKDEGRIPITVVLRRFAAEHAERTPAIGTARHLTDFLFQAWKKELEGWEDPELKELKGATMKALKDGTAILFFDGLDEAPEDNQKEFICSAVKSFGDSYPECRIVLTCRIFSYVDQKWAIDGFPSVQLAELDDTKIQRFINAWFDPDSPKLTQERSRVKVLRDRLFPAILDRGLRDLAGNPMQLTNMALLHSCEELPDSRAKLYERLVRLLLFSWDENRFRKDEQVSPLRALLQQADCKEDEFINGIAKLAYEVHQPQLATHAGKSADVGEGALLLAMEELHPKTATDKKTRDEKAVWAKDIVASFRARGGLLREEVRRVFRFPHRSYQEFLAGRHLTNGQYFPDFAAAAEALFEQNPYWRESTSWAAAVQTFVNNNKSAALSLATALLGKPGVFYPAAVAGRRSILAGEILAEIGALLALKHPIGSICLPKTVRQLIEGIGTPDLPPLERAQAGRTLARLGDPRPGVTPTSIDDLDQMEFCFVPPGRFHFGEGRKGGWNESLSAQGYWIARYPVTVAQYRLFLDDGGYKDSKYWNEAGTAGFWKNGKGKVADLSGGGDGWQEGAAEYGLKFGFLNQPVVGVNWYEATAYTRWLSQKLAAKLPEGWRVALPTEQEWEKAARGGEGLARTDSSPIIRTIRSGLVQPIEMDWVPNPSPRREYPWDGPWRDDYANWGETKIGAASAVGCFPFAASPTGAEEMSGNVWEWTDSRYDSDKDARVLRGGSWISNLPENLRVAYRYSDHPESRNNNFGFRCVLVHGSLPRTGL